MSSIKVTSNKSASVETRFKILIGYDGSVTATYQDYAIVAGFESPVGSEGAVPWPSDSPQALLDAVQNVMNMFSGTL